VKTETSIFSSDYQALDNPAIQGAKAKKVFATYWE